MVKEVNLQNVFKIIKDISYRFQELGKVSRIRLGQSELESAASSSLGGRSKVMAQFFASKHCCVCGALSNSAVCVECARDAQKCVVHLSDKVRKWDRSWRNLQSMCASCSGFQTVSAFDSSCLSFDCPVLYARKKAKFDRVQIDYAENLLKNFAI